MLVQNGRPASCPLPLRFSAFRPLRIELYSACVYLRQELRDAKSLCGGQRETLSAFSGVRCTRECMKPPARGCMPQLISSFRLPLPISVSIVSRPHGI